MIKVIRSINLMKNVRKGLLLMFGNLGRNVIINVIIQINVIVKEICFFVNFIDDR